VTDVTNGVNGRQLDTELPPFLTVNLIRGSVRPDIKLQLEENTLLNQNAPMFTSDGKKTVQLKDDVHLKVFDNNVSPLCKTTFLSGTSHQVFKTFAFYLN